MLYRKLHTFMMRYLRSIMKIRWQDKVTNIKVALLLDLFVNCLVKQFAIFLGVVALLSLNVMDVLIVGGGALLYDLPKNVCVVSVIPVCI